MTEQRPENSVPPAGVSGNSATIAWGEKQPDAPEAKAADGATAADAALDQIDRLIGRINSTSSVALTAPLTALVVPEESAVGKSGPDDDEALRDYMDQFLERVTGKKNPEPDGAGTQTSSLAAPMAPLLPEKPREIKRAPESVQDMSLMRALAKETALRARGADAGQRLIAGTRNSFLGALSLSLISSLLAVISLMGEAGWAWNSAVLVMLLALVLTGRFHLLGRQVQKLNGCEAAP